MPIVCMEACARMQVGIQKQRLSSSHVLFSQDQLMAHVIKDCSIFESIMRPILVYSFCLRCTRINAGRGNIDPSYPFGIAPLYPLRIYPFTFNPIQDQISICDSSGSSLPHAAPLKFPITFQVSHRGQRGISVAMSHFLSFCESASHSLMHLFLPSQREHAVSYLKPFS